MILQSIKLHESLGDIDDEVTDPLALRYKVHVVNSTEIAALLGLDIAQMFLLQIVTVLVDVMLGVLPSSNFWLCRFLRCRIRPTLNPESPMLSSSLMILYMA